MHPIFIFAIVLAAILLSGLRIVQEYQRGVVFRLGRFKEVRGPGLFWIIPLNIENSVKIDIRTRTVSAEQQETITRDSVTVKARIIKAEAEMEASEKLAMAAARMAENPAALELRRFQMIAEVGAENNSTTVIMIPSDFVNLSHSLSDYLRDHARPPTAAKD